MQTQLIEQKDGLAKLSIQIPATDVDRTFSTTFQELSRRVKVPGFRPGKAPRGVIEAKVGKQTLAEEVRDVLVDTYCPEALRELELNAIHLHVHADAEPVPGQDYTFEVEAELFPDITLPNYEDFVIDSEAQPLTDEMVQQAALQLREDYTTLVPVERPAQAGDYVLLETIGDNPGTLPIDLEKAGDEIASQLISKAIGDEFDLTFTHQDEDEDDVEADGDAAPAEQTEAGENEAAKQAETATGSHTHTLKVTVKDIKEKDKPEVGDDLAKDLGFDTWSEAEVKLRESLQAQLEQEAFEEQQEEFIDKLMAESEFPLPDSLVNRRKLSLLDSLSKDLQRRGLTLESYLEQLEVEGERQGFEDQLTENARRGVKRDLLLQTLLDKSGVSLSDGEFAEALSYLAARQRTDVNRLRRELGEDGLDNYRFLLARDKAVRETVKKLLGQEESEPDIKTRAAKSGIIVP